MIVKKLDIEKFEYVKKRKVVTKNQKYVTYFQDLNMTSLKIFVISWFKVINIEVVNK